MDTKRGSTDGDTMQSRGRGWGEKRGNRVRIEKGKWVGVRVRGFGYPPSQRVKNQQVPHQVMRFRPATIAFRNRTNYRGRMAGNTEDTKLIWRGEGVVGRGFSKQLERGN